MISGTDNDNTNRLQMNFLKRRNIDVTNEVIIQWKIYHH